MNVQNKIYEKLATLREFEDEAYYTHKEIYEMIRRYGIGRVSAWRAVNALWTSGFLESEVEKNGASIKRLFRAVNKDECNTYRRKDLDITRTKKQLGY